MRRIATVSAAVAILSLSLAGASRNAGSAARPQTNAAASPQSEGGATFTLRDGELHSPLTLIVYGDIRFTDPSNTTVTSPNARRALIARIAEEKADALLINGDIPWRGGDKPNYEVYRTETQVWRDMHLRIFPALGNHEFYGCEVPQCLANWWESFPELNGRRWYSVRIGTKVYALALDSDDSLLAGSDQQRWVAQQIASLPAGVKFVFVAMHHPPVADIQTRFNVDHNPRPNEIALAQELAAAASTSKAKFIVSAGHIHNYERFQQDGVVYLVSGGGGAMPYQVDRTPPDLYQDAGFPNYHYVKFVLKGNTLKATMYRLSDPNAPKWEAKDAFEIKGK